MEKTKRITKAQRFEEIINILKDTNASADLIKFTEEELERIRNKNANRKPTEADLKNERIKDEILNRILTKENGLTATEVMKRVTVEEVSSNQKAASLLRALCEAGKVEKRAEGGKSKFYKL